MVKTLIKNERYCRMLAFLVSALTASLFVIASTVRTGVFFIGSDFVHQQIPFWSSANRLIKEGNILWDDTLDLGTQFIGGYSFYTIGSPFFWLSLLFSGDKFYLCSGIFLILKYAVAGMTSYCFIRQYTRTSYAALVGSLIYSFSGFQISNQNFFHFADIVALFPLVLLALDLTMKKGKKGIFAFIVGIVAICSWFNFFGIAVFISLYFIMKVLCKDYLLNSNKFFQLVFESVIGVGVSAVILIPSILFNLANPRAMKAFTGLYEMLIIKPFYLADLLRGFLFPPECGFSRAFFLNGVFNGGEIYIPLFGIVLASSYFLLNRKNFETRLILVSALFMLIPVLNSSFVAFNAEYYTRWFYMPILILCLASAKALEDESLSLKKGYITYGVIFGLFAIVCIIFHFFTEVPIFNNKYYALVFMFINLMGFVITLFLRKIQKLKLNKLLILAMVSFFAATVGFINIKQMNSSCWDANAPEAFFTSPEYINLPLSEQYYRIDSDGYYFYNLSVMTGYPSIGSFSSTVSGSIFNFYDLCGEPRSVISDLPDSRIGYHPFLSTKYLVKYNLVSEEDIHDHIFIDKQGDYSIYENTAYIPLGFTYDSYITKEQFLNIPSELRHFTLLKALVIDEDQISPLFDILNPISSDDFSDLNYESIAQDVDNRRKESCYYSKRTNEGYMCRINLSEEKVLFFSIPYDEGWSVKINGIMVDIHKVTGGFMAIRVPAGENEIIFEYFPKGLKIGMTITAGSIILLLIYILVSKRKESAKNLVNSII